MLPELFYMMNYLRFVGALIFVLLVATQVMAQQAAGEIEDLEITIDKNRTLTLPEVIPDPSRIPLPIKPIVIPKQKYNYVEYNVKLPETEPKIKVLTMKGETQQVYPGLHLRAGLGLPLATYAEGLYRSNAVKNMTWGLHGKHFALFNGPQYRVNTGYSENFVKGFTSYYSDLLTIDGDLGYYRNAVNYYGIGKEVERSADSVRQYYQYFKANVLFRQNQKTGPFTWQSGLNFSNMTDAYHGREFTFDLNGNFGYELDSISGIKADLAFLLSRYNTTKADSTAQGRNAFWLSPVYYRQLNELYIEVGANVAFENDTFSNTQRIHFYPNLKASLSLIPKRLTLHAGITGNLDKRTLQSNIAQNPWLGQRIALAHTNRKLDAYGAADFRLTNSFQLNAKVSYRQLQNLPLYLNQITDSSRFGIFYDRGTVTQFQTLVGATFKPNQKLTAALEVELNNYKMADATQPWHLPGLVIAANASYQATKQLLTAIRLNYQGDLKALAIATGKEVTVPGMLNIGLRGHYQINQKFGAFVDIDNLLNQQNQHYYNYPTRGLLFMIGGTYTLQASK